MSQPDSITVETCRSCSKKYTFLLQNDQIVTVMCGRPSNVTYKAVSYTWGQTSPLPLKCRKCSAIKHFPMRDASKLQNLLNLVRGGSTIWLDALSIDQDDENDKKLQLMVMGDIYREAEIASVLLPEEDKEAYEMLKKLAIKSDEIVQEHNELGFLNDASLEGEMENALSTLATDFLAIMEDWEANISRWKYWSRAWTFQEWAMAREIEISFENAPNNEGLKNIKNVVVMASTIVGQWKMRQTRIFDKFQGGLSAQLRIREKCGRYLNIVRRHFPFKDFLMADEEESTEALRQMTYMSSMHSAASGTFVHLQTRHERISSLRQRLGLALNAMSPSHRVSMHPADRVACWASMCSIEYDYRAEDSFAIALHKVLTALRRKGFKIYNFHVNTVGGETDLKFLEYAAAQKQSNSASEANFFGIPIFVGKTDTIQHINNLLEPTAVPGRLPSSFKVHLSLVDNAEVRICTSLSERRSVTEQFNDLVIGRADDIQTKNVIPMIEELFDKTSTGNLAAKSLVTVSITVKDFQTSYPFQSWAIIPSHIVQHSLRVARESLNGTLVLATVASNGKAEIVVYLTMTHQRHGTYLIQCSEERLVDVVFKNPDPELLRLMDAIYPDPVLEVALTFPEFDVLETVDRAMNVEIELGDEKIGLVGRDIGEMEGNSMVELSL